MTLNGAAITTSNIANDLSYDVIYTILICQRL